MMIAEQLRDHVSVPRISGNHAVGLRFVQNLAEPVLEFIKTTKVPPHHGGAVEQRINAVPQARHVLDNFQMRLTDGAVQTAVGSLDKISDLDFDVFRDE